VYLNSMLLGSAGLSMEVGFIPCDVTIDLAFV